MRGSVRFLFGQKGSERMNLQSYEERIRRKFDSFCKRVLKHNALDIQRQTKRRRESEIAFSGLTKQELKSLAVTDKYFADLYIFSVLGETVSVSDYELGEALNTLSAERRDIVLMSYFFDMTDKQIADKLKVARRTVSYRRTNSLQELKKIMESEE